LVVVLAIAVIVSVWLSKQQADKNHLLQEENASLRAKLRGELGELEISDSDRDKLQAIAIPTIEPMTWKWRLYIPPGRLFWIDSEINGVSDANIPARGSGCSLQSGEQVLTVALRKDESTGNWQWIEHCGSTMCGPVLTPQQGKWIERPSNINVNSAAQKWQVVVQPHEPLELLRYRSFPFPKPNQPGPASLSGVGDGILIWIREENPSK
jgi:hypothetical protein